MEPLAQVSDVWGLWRPLTDDEQTVASNKIDVASALLRHQLPDVDARIEAGTLSVVLVAAIIAEAVKRSMQGDPEGLRSRTDTRGPFTETRAYRDAAEYGLHFTPAELSVLRGGGRPTTGTRVGSIHVRSRWLDDLGMTGPRWWHTWTS